MTESHRVTTAELLVRRQQRRSALAEALFTGGSGPESWPWEISALLGLPVNADLVVVTADTLRAADEGLPGVESRLAEHGGSAERTGAALYCHPNTIRNRLRRLQELTRRDLADPWQMSEVAAALQAYGLRAGPDR